MHRDHPDVWAKIGPAERPMALLVDDDVSYRSTMSEILTEDGWDVVETSTGEDALTLLDADKKFVVLVIDINLGDGMDGWALGRFAANNRPDIGLLFISGQSHPDWQDQHASSARFLLKPFSLASLLTSIGGAAEVAHRTASEARSRLGDSTD